MVKKNPVRQNLTNFDVAKQIKEEISAMEDRLFRKILLVAIGSVVSITLFIVVYVSSNANVVRDYAAEAMRKAFQAEQAVQIIDEAAGTHFLDQSFPDSSFSPSIFSDSSFMDASSLDQDQSDLDQSKERPQE
ncbi:hypothetical protein L4C36_11365 [Photobacterium japonica]|uniref:hypothetical protein n=1 Tax=Photobacterium japonica TaxID=2910235 RepID=UPI003D14A2B3